MRESAFMMEHSRQIGWRIHMPCIEARQVLMFDPQTACNQIPDDCRRLKVRFHRPIQRGNVEPVMFYPACWCIEIATRRIDIVNRVPFLFQSAFGYIIIVDTAQLVFFDGRTVISVRHAQRTDMPVPLLSCFQRERPILRMAQRKHIKSVPCRT